MKSCFAAFWFAALLPASVLLSPAGAADSHPLPLEGREALLRDFESVIARTTERVRADKANVDLYSRRGDAYFFRGEFAKAVTDYDRMVELKPGLDASHWRRGIALFYARRFEDAARQFERYHSFDDVDRENGIWRYLSQVKADGREHARAGLLKYKKDDREPFPAVYQLFAGKITPEEILRQIDSADVDKMEREKRLFYAHLYVGLNHAVEGRSDAALPHLRKAVANSWAPGAGYGPSYMWQVARLHYEQLAEAVAQPE